MEKPLCGLARGSYYVPMQPHSGRGRRWRRFSHNYGVFVFVACLVLVVVAVVGFVMYMLTSMSWRLRY